LRLGVKQWPIFNLWKPNTFACGVFEPYIRLFIET